VLDDDDDEEAVAEAEHAHWDGAHAADARAHGATGRAAVATGDARGARSPAAVGASSPDAARVPESDTPPSAAGVRWRDAERVFVYPHEPTLRAALQAAGSARGPAGLDAGWFDRVVVRGEVAPPEAMPATSHGLDALPPLLPPSDPPPPLLPADAAGRGGGGGGGVVQYVMGVLDVAQAAFHAVLGGRGSVASQGSTQPMQEWAEGAEAVAASAPPQLEEGRAGAAHRADSPADASAGAGGDGARQQRIRTVAIRGRELTLLAPGQCLNDSCIDWWSEYLQWRGVSDARKRARLRIASALYYQALHNAVPRSAARGRRPPVRTMSTDFGEPMRPNTTWAQWQATRQWTRNVPLFDLCFWVVPIHLAFHWSLAIVCNLPALRRRLDLLHASLQALPAARLNDVDVMTAVAVASSSSDDHPPVIAVADSLGAHDSGAITAVLRGVLLHEWCHRYNRGAQVGTAPTAPTPPPESSHQVVGWHGLERVPANMLPTVQLAFPPQTNGFDCGVFVNRYMWEWLRAWDAGVIPDAGVTQRMVDSQCSAVTDHAGLDSAAVEETRRWQLALLRRLGEEPATLRRLSVPRTPAGPAALWEEVETLPQPAAGRSGLPRQARLRAARMASRSSSTSPADDDGTRRTFSGAGHVLGAAADIAIPAPLDAGQLAAARLKTLGGTSRHATGHPHATGASVIAAGAGIASAGAWDADMPVFPTLRNADTAATDWAMLCAAPSVHVAPDSAGMPQLEGGDTQPTRGHGASIDLDAEAGAGGHGHVHGSDVHMAAWPASAPPAPAARSDSPRPPAPALGEGSGGSAPHAGKRGKRRRKSSPAPRSVEEPPTDAVTDAQQVVISDGE
jgi:hypothetical protein